MTPLLLAVTLAELSPSDPITATPRHAIDDVLARFTKTNRSSTVTGIAFDRHNRTFLHWDVYYTQNRRSMEIEFNDAGLDPSRPKVVGQRPMHSRLTFAQALTRTRNLQPGIVTSLELERDEEKGIVWSAEIQHGGRTYELYISPTNGRVIDREIKPKVNHSDEY